MFVVTECNHAGLCCLILQDDHLVPQSTTLTEHEQTKGYVIRDYIRTNRLSLRLVGMIDQLVKFIRRQVAEYMRARFTSLIG